MNISADSEPGYGVWIRNEAKFNIQELNPWLHTYSWMAKKLLSLYTPTFSNEIIFGKSYVITVSPGGTHTQQSILSFLVYWIFREPIFHVKSIRRHHLIFPGLAGLEAGFYPVLSWNSGSWKAWAFVTQTN